MPAKGLTELAKICDQFDVIAPGVDPILLPRPTVALIGSNDWREPRQWARIQRTIEEFVEQCSDRGYQAVLHNEVGTQIASQDAIIRSLQTPTWHSASIPGTSSRPADTRSRFSRLS